MILWLQVNGWQTHCTHIAHTRALKWAFIRWAFRIFNSNTVRWGRDATEKNVIIVLQRKVIKKDGFSLWMRCCECETELNFGNSLNWRITFALSAAISWTKANEWDVATTVSCQCISCARPSQCGVCAAEVSWRWTHNVNLLTCVYSNMSFGMKRWYSRHKVSREWESAPAHTHPANHPPVSDKSKWHIAQLQWNYHIHKNANINKR